MERIPNGNYTKEFQAEEVKMRKWAVGSSSRTEVIVADFYSIHVGNGLYIHMLTRGGSGVYKLHKESSARGISQQNHCAKFVIKLDSNG